MKLKININFLKKSLADLINGLEYKRIKEKIKECNLPADKDDQSSYHFGSFNL